MLFAISRRPEYAPGQVINALVAINAYPASWKSAISRARDAITWCMRGIRSQKVCSATVRLELTKSH
jgi:hypothetical protein